MWCHVSICALANRLKQLHPPRGSPYPFHLLHLFTASYVSQGCRNILFHSCVLLKDPDAFPRQVGYAIPFSIFCVRLRVTSLLYRAERLNGEDWFNVIHDIFVMEKLTFHLRLRVDMFDDYWKVRTEFIKQFRSDFMDERKNCRIKYTTISCYTPILGFLFSSSFCFLSFSLAFLFFCIA